MIKYGIYPYEVPTLLPPNASPLERRIEQLLAAKFAKLDVDIVRAIKDPYQTPYELLPWLAWEYSVDWYNDLWPEELKRNWIAKSPKLHLEKGTPWAVEDALETLGLKADWVDWFADDEGQKPAGTFRMEVYRLTDNEAYLSLWDVEQVVEATKCDTRHMARLNLGVVSLDANIKVAAGLVTGEIIEVDPFVPADIDANYVAIRMTSYPSIIERVSIINN